MPLIPAATLLIVGCTTEAHLRVGVPVTLLTLLVALLLI